MKKTLMTFFSYILLTNILYPSLANAALYEFSFEGIAANRSSDVNSGIVGGGSLEGSFIISSDVFENIPPLGQQKDASSSVSKFEANFIQADGVDLYGMPINYKENIAGIDTTVTIDNIGENLVKLSVRGSDRAWKIANEIIIPFVCPLAHVLANIDPITCEIITDTLVWLGDTDIGLDEHYDLIDVASSVQAVAAPSNYSLMMVISAALMAMYRKRKSSILRQVKEC